MSVNVKCIMCEEFFEVTKQSADSESLGFQIKYDFFEKETGTTIKVFCTASPIKGDLCPACALEFIERTIKHNKKQIPQFMKGIFK